ncbi:MAG: hypothetical protein IT537_04675, partial [Hyphomicrobiales bacterium]|nr:hypothetical protein [Hyphomicrobiales bacterium]
MPGSIYDWSLSAAGNATADPAVNWQENQDPDTVNNSARQMMARHAEWLDDTGLLRASTGSLDNQYAIAIASQPSALADGMGVTFIPHITNTADCQLAVNALGVAPLRPAPGVAFKSGEVAAGVPVTAIYRALSAEWVVTSGTGVYVNLLAPALLTANVFGFGVGDVKLSLAPTPDPGFVRLKETVQNLLKTDYPDLNAWASGKGYPWGSTSTTFGVPPAAGYFLRFAGADASVDPGGPRTAGSTQGDQNKSHTHAAAFAGTPHTHDISGSTNNAAGGTGASPISSLQTDGVSGNRDGGTTAITAGGTVTVTQDGGSEARPKNVAMHADMLAKPALVAASVVGVVGYAYRWSASVANADPGAGFVGADNSDLSLASVLYVNKTDMLGGSMSPTIADWLSGGIPKGTIKLQKAGAPSNWATFTVSGAGTDGGTFARLTLTPISVNGTFTASDQVSVQFFPLGAIGSAGPNTGYQFQWDTGTADADPGAGKVRANHATIGSATFLYVSKTSSAGANIGARIGEWGASTSTPKGTLRLFSTSSPGNEINCSITGACVDATTYWKVPVSGGVLTGTIADGADLSGVVERVGNAGANGAGSGTVTSVGLTMPAEFSVSGGPVTNAGTLTVTKADASANTVYAGPATGSPAAPSMRALVANDLPAGAARDLVPLAVTGGNLLVGNGAALDVLGIGPDGYGLEVDAADVSGRKVVWKSKTPTTTLWIGNAAGGADVVQTYTWKAGCKAIRVTLQGAGGGGAGSPVCTTAQASVGGGGGAGAPATDWVDRAAFFTAYPSGSLPVTLKPPGAGGAAGAAGANSGGSSSFGTLVSASGGIGGSSMAVTTTVGVAAGGLGGASSNAIVDTRGA